MATLGRRLKKMGQWIPSFIRLWFKWKEGKRYTQLSNTGQGVAVPCLSSSPSCKVVWQVVRTVWNLFSQRERSLRLPCVSLPETHKAPRLFLAPSLKFLGKFQFLGIYCFNSLMSKRRGTGVYWEYLHSCQGVHMDVYTGGICSQNM